MAVSRFPYYADRTWTLWVFLLGLWDSQHLPNLFKLRLLRWIAKCLVLKNIIEFWTHLSIPCILVFTGRSLLVIIQSIGTDFFSMVFSFANSFSRMFRFIQAKPSWLEKNSIPYAILNPPLFFYWINLMRTFFKIVHNTISWM